MESLGEELAERFGVPPPRVLMQGGKLRALEFKFPLPVSLRRARELSQAASEREVLIEPDRPGSVQLLVDAAPAPPAVGSAGPASPSTLPRGVHVRKRA